MIKKGTANESVRSRASSGDVHLWGGRLPPHLISPPNCRNSQAIQLGTLMWGLVGAARGGRRFLASWTPTYTCQLRGRRKIRWEAGRGHGAFLAPGRGSGARRRAWTVRNRGACVWRISALSTGLARRCPVLLAAVGTRDVVAWREASSLAPPRFGGSPPESVTHGRPRVENQPHVPRLMDSTHRKAGTGNGRGGRVICTVPHPDDLTLQHVDRHGVIWAMEGRVPTWRGKSS